MQSNYTFLTHGGGVVEDPHAVSLYEGLSAELDVGNVLEADQQAFTYQHMAMPRVIAMPIQVQSKQDRHVVAIHCTASICLCTGK